LTEKKPTGADESGDESKLVKGSLNNIGQLALENRKDQSSEGTAKKGTKPTTTEPKPTNDLANTSNKRAAKAKPKSSETAE
jgi:hypothetical protein